MDFRNKKFFLVILFILFLGLIYLVSVLEAGSADSNIKSFTDALWYSIVTLTTVGYGDFYPVTPAGKTVGIIIIISSLGFLGYLIGQMSNIIRNYMEKKKEGFHGTNFDNHSIIIGWDTFAKQVADQVVSANRKLAIITNKKDNIDLIYDMYGTKNVFVLFTDFSNVPSFSRASIDKASAVYLNLPDDSANLVFIINMRKLYNKTNFIVTLNNPELRETYNSLGIKYTISKTDIASRLVASYIFEPDVACLTEDFMTTSVLETDYDMQEYRVIEDNEYVNQSYFDVFVHLKKTCNAVLLGIVKIKGDERTIIKNPEHEIIVSVNDYLLLTSDGYSKGKLRKIFKVNEGV
jgi:voltage-gated potassium channel